jgi:hypothetical protein
MAGVEFTAQHDWGRGTYIPTVPANRFPVAE